MASSSSCEPLLQVSQRCDGNLVLVPQLVQINVVMRVPHGHQAAVPNYTPRASTGPTTTLYSCDNCKGFCFTSQEPPVVFTNGESYFYMCHSCTRNWVQCVLEVSIERLNPWHITMAKWVHKNNLRLSTTTSPIWPL